MAQRDAVFPAGRHDLYTSQTYSAAIRSGDLLFVSGQVGSRSDGSPEPDFEAQVVWHSLISRRPCKRVDAGLTTSST